MVQMNTDKDKYTDPLSDILMNIPEGTTGSSIVSSIMSLSTALVYREYTVEGIVKEDNLLAFENEMIKQYIKDNDLTVSETVVCMKGQPTRLLSLSRQKRI